MNYNELFDFDYEEHDFITSQALLQDLVDAGEVHPAEAKRFLGSTIFGYNTALGLSTSHIFAQHHDKIKPKAFFWKGASLVGCKRLSVRMGEGSRSIK